MGCEVQWYSYGVLTMVLGHQADPWGGAVVLVLGLAAVLRLAPAEEGW